MKTQKSLTVVLLFAVITLGLSPVVAGQGIYLDHADGISTDNCVPENGMVTFHMRVVGDEDDHLMLNNGFKICMDDRSWSGVTVEYNPEYPLNLWFDFVLVHNVWDGPFCDTVGFGFLSLLGSGLPPNFDDILFSMTIGPVSGYPEMGQTLTLDSSWFPPSNPWMWDIVGTAVDWGGPYTWTCSQYVPYTYCEPQPTILKDIEKVLEIYIMGYDPDDIVWESIRVQGKIPPLDGYPVVENGYLVIGVSIMRFLGYSGFRPITADFETTYTVEFDMVGGEHIVLIGDFSLIVYPGDVTFDGQCDMNDVIFMADYFWNGGGVCFFDGYEVSEFMDVNGDGEINPLDMRKMIELAGL